MISRRRGRREIFIFCSFKEFGVRCGRGVKFRNFKISIEVVKDIWVVVRREEVFRSLYVYIFSLVFRY